MHTGTKSEVFDKYFSDVFVPEARGKRMSLQGMLNWYNIVGSEWGSFEAFRPPFAKLVVGTHVKIEAVGRRFRERISDVVSFTDQSESR